MSRIAAGLKSTEYIYTNLARERDRVMGEAAASLGVFALFLMLYLIAALMILGRVFTFSLLGITRKIAVLRAMGMERRVILRSYGLESLFYCVCGYGAAILVMAGIWSTRQLFEYGGKAPILSLVFSDGCLGFPWRIFLAFGLVTAGVVAALYYIPVRRFVKLSVIEQLGEL